MKELLQRYGYEFTGKCNCDGYTTEKYLSKNKQYHVRVRTGKGQFKIKRGGTSLTKWESLSLLQQTLSNINSNALVSA